MKNDTSYQIRKLHCGLRKKRTLYVSDRSNYLSFYYYFYNRMKYILFLCRLFFIFRTFAWQSLLSFFNYTFHFSNIVYVYLISVSKNRRKIIYFYRHITCNKIDYKHFWIFFPSCFLQKHVQKFSFKNSILINYVYAKIFPSCGVKVSYIICTETWLLK